MSQKPVPPSNDIIYDSTYTGQTHKHSLLESIVNILIGYGIAISAQLVIFPLYNIHIPLQHNLAIGGWMTLVSLVRSYCLRRWFNRITIRQYK